MSFTWKPGKADDPRGLFVKPATAPGLRDLYEWYNRDSFFCAWELVKQAQEGQFTAWDLSHALGCSQRTIYRWLNEETYLPQAYFLQRMAVLFHRILGDDWMEKVEQLQVALGTKKQSTKGETNED